MVLVDDIKGRVRTEKINSYDETKKENGTYLSERKNHKLSTSFQLLLTYLLYLSLNVS